MSQTLPQLRAVICEDEGMTILLLRHALTKAGYEVVGETDNGLKAVELVSRLKPDFIMMDINLPGLSGIEAIRRILAERSIPVIMLTAYSDSQIVGEAIEAGACAYLVKPIVGDQLGPAIRTALARFETFVSITKENEDLKESLETRKIVERAKGILMDRTKMPEAEAFKRLQKISRDRCQTLKQTAKEIISADTLFQA